MSSSPEPNANGDKGKKDPISEATLAARKQYAFEIDMMEDAFERKNMEVYKELGGVDAICQGLKSDIHLGIQLSSLESRREAFGTNVLTEKPPVTLLELIWEALKDPLVRILIVAAFVSMILGLTTADPHTGKVDRKKGWIEGFAILIAVAVVVGVGAGNDYQKSKKFEEMKKKQAEKNVQVIREGQQITIDSKELVVGDVLVLERGQELVADGLLIEGQDVKVNESSITGETLLIKKRPNTDAYFLNGTSLEEGSGRILIVGVGMNSSLGRLKKATEGDDEGEDTPLQQKLGDLADQVAKVGGVLSTVLLICLCIKEIVAITRDGKEAIPLRFLRFVVVCITLVVVCIPEGLPLAVAISLAYAMSSMMDERCMVRIMSSCETMGAATAICSDKTGTLTTNIMTVVQGLVTTEEFVLSNYGITSRVPTIVQQPRDNLQLTMSKPILEKFCFALSVNTSAMEQVNKNKDGSTTTIWVGDSTERGLLGFVKTAQLDYMALRTSVPANQKRQYPFSSEKKRMTTVVCDPGTGGYSIYRKGASEWILADCTMLLDRSGDIIEMTPEKRTLILDCITDMANQGNRTIGISYGPAPGMSLPSPRTNRRKMILFSWGFLASRTLCARRSRWLWRSRRWRVSPSAW